MVGKKGDSLKKKYSQRKRVQMCPTLRLRGDQTGMGEDKGRRSDPGVVGGKGRWPR